MSPDGRAGGTKGGGRLPPMPLRIFAIGRVAVEAGDVLVEHHLGSRQARLAFAFLLAERNRAVSRDELAELLWPSQLPRSWETGGAGCGEQGPPLPRGRRPAGGRNSYLRLRLLPAPPAARHRRRPRSDGLGPGRCRTRPDRGRPGCRRVPRPSWRTPSQARPSCPGRTVNGSIVAGRSGAAQLLRALEILAEVWSQRGEVAQGVAGCRGGRRPRTVPGDGPSSPHAGARRRRESG